MKNTLNKLFTIAAAAFLLSSCEDNAIPVRTDYVSDGALVKLYNHVEGSGNVNYYLNDQRITANTALANGALRGLAFGSTFPSTYGYANVPAGSFNLIVRDTATMTPDTFNDTAKLAVNNCKPVTWKALASPYNKIAEKAVTLDRGASYTAILVGTPVVMGTRKTVPATDTSPEIPGNCGQIVTPATYELLFTRDNLPAPDFSKVYFRFAHNLANAPYNFDVVATRAAKAASGTTPAVEKVETVIATNIGFKEFGQYVEVPLGDYNVDFYKAGTWGTAAPVKYYTYTSSSGATTITSIALGRVYTFFLRGTHNNAPRAANVDYWRER
ncbi:MULTISPECIES: DUF4397 domain-containing protein [Rufibacter]|uniref:DUF4397 domain-containing protein n=1 Tax=Rufibacter quisquiliarum TaxID=1549639 RepID=A0A839GNC2_9BACT|nr:MULTISPECIES: DUF4397 domain-containing protein [Rufibacter]MBA9075928.1 hypothetical protein [Rufibacter quisquiliarum]